MPPTHCKAVYTPEGDDSEVIHACDLYVMHLSRLTIWNSCWFSVVTLPDPKDVTPPVPEVVDDGGDDDGFVVNDDSITLSQAFGAPLGLDLQAYYEQEVPAPAPDGLFDSDDEYHEMTYKPLTGKKKKVTCIAQELYHAEVAELRRNEDNGQVRTQAHSEYRTTLIASAGVRQACMVLSRHTFQEGYRLSGLYPVHGARRADQEHALHHQRGGEHFRTQ